MDPIQDLQRTLIELCNLNNAQAQSVSEYVGSDRDVTDCIDDLAFDVLGRTCISAALRRARREAGWSEDKACREHGISIKTLEQYEDGAPPKQVTKLRVWFTEYGIERGSDLLEGLLAIARAG